MTRPSRAKIAFDGPRAGSFAAPLHQPPPEVAADFQHRQRSEEQAGRDSNDDGREVHVQVHPGFYPDICRRFALCGQGGFASSSTSGTSDGQASILHGERDQRSVGGQQGQPLHLRRADQQTIEGIAVSDWQIGSGQRVLVH